jgi:hypothetical protein
VKGTQTKEAVIAALARGEEADSRSPVSAPFGLRGELKLAERVSLSGPTRGE